MVVKISCSFCLNSLWMLLGFDKFLELLRSLILLFSPHRPHILSGQILVCSTSECILKRIPSYALYCYSHFLLDIETCSYLIFSSSTLTTHIICLHIVAIESFKHKLLLLLEIFSFFSGGKKKAAKYLYWPIILSYFSDLIHSFAISAPVALGPLLFLEHSKHGPANPSA